MPIGAALRLVGSRGTLTLTSQKPIVTIESYRPQTIRQCLSGSNSEVPMCNQEARFTLKNGHWSAC